MTKAQCCRYIQFSVQFFTTLCVVECLVVFCLTKQFFCRCLLLQEIVAANSGLPFPCTLSDPGSNRADYRMIDRLRRQGVCWRCACVYHFVCPC